MRNHVFGATVCALAWGQTYQFYQADPYQAAAEEQYQQYAQAQQYQQAVLAEESYANEVVATFLARVLPLCTAS